MSSLLCRFWLCSIVRLQYFPNLTILYSLYFNGWFSFNTIAIRAVSRKLRKNGSPTKKCIENISYAKSELELCTTVYSDKKMLVKFGQHYDIKRNIIPRDGSKDAARAKPCFFYSILSQICRQRTVINILRKYRDFIV